VGFTLTERLPGAVDAPGVTVSQLPPLLVEGVTVKGVVTPFVVLSASCWLCGTVLLVGKLNDSEVGAADMGDVPDVFTFKMTGTMATAVEPDVTVMKPS